jgi:hypothetical protein
VRLTGRIHIHSKILTLHRFDSLNALLSARDTLFGIIADSRSMQSIMHLSEKDARQVQVNILLDACKISQSQNRAHESLSMVTYLSDLLPSCEKSGLDESLQIQESIADILWAQNEQVAAIQILSSLTSQPVKLGDPARAAASHKSAAILAKLVRIYSFPEHLFLTRLGSSYWRSTPGESRRNNTKISGAGVERSD